MKKSMLFGAFLFASCSQNDPQQHTPSKATQSPATESSISSVAKPKRNYDGFTADIENGEAKIWYDDKVVGEASKIDSVIGFDASNGIAYLRSLEGDTVTVELK
jgi:hypothetical protein